MKLNDIQKIIFNKVVWFQASSIANFLKYGNTNKAIMDHVNEHDKVRFSEIIQNSSILYSKQDQGSLILLQEKNHPNTIFINENGVFDLITRSRMSVIAFKRETSKKFILPQIKDINKKVFTRSVDQKIV